MPQLLVTFLLLILLTACQEDTPPPAEPDASKSNADAMQAQPEPPTKPDTEPPTPPVFEDFQGEPKLSLFPRVGDYRPEDGHERLPFWNTFIDHLSKISGLVENPGDNNRAWSFRNVNTIDSLGYFAPLGVEPKTNYNVSFKLKAQLPEGASAGIGIIEFNEFLWVGEQYTEQRFQDHYRGVHEGVRLTGDTDWEEHGFTFTTGPETRMIHLVLFREGTHDRNGVLFDDIKVGVAGGE